MLDIIQWKGKEAQVPEIETFLKRMKAMELGVVTPLVLWLFTSECNAGASVGEVLRCWKVMG